MFHALSASNETRAAASLVDGVVRAIQLPTLTSARVLFGSSAHIIVPVRGDSWTARTIPSKRVAAVHFSYDADSTLNIFVYIFH